ncbi:TPA: GyrI-like domain-containing protein [Staphylococcus aureus]|uniref:GyrI-like domain-containing protein n=1 Tax=Staphylococcus aureus TaxID=1280 RepID=UPI003D15EB63
MEGGLYLILRIEHTSQAVQNLYMRLHELVSESGYEYDNTRVIMERYIVNVVEQHECDICIPIKY